MDRKKNRGKKFDEDEPPTKEEYAVAKFLRFSVPTREAKLHNMEVQCFFASAAVDALLMSKWSAFTDAKEPLFYNRSSCVFYCQRLMQKGLFHRAERVQRKKDKDKGDNKDKGDKSRKRKGKELLEKEETGTSEELKERKGKKDRKGKKEKDDAPAGDKSQTLEKDDGDKKEEKSEEKKEEKKDEGKKKKEKRLKLIMTDDQRFLDGEENIYVWIYDPANLKTLVIGSLIVLGAIALCLFPLWPEMVRLGVYYISLAAAGFVGFILALVVIRLILFCAVWLLSLGRHHFWLLPNLTEDVGFFDSFRPLYQHDTVTKDAPVKEKSKSSSSLSSSKSSSKKLPVDISESDRKAAAKRTEKDSDKEESGSEQEGFEVIDRGEVEEREAGELDEGDADSKQEEAEKDHHRSFEGEEEEEEGEDYEEEEEEQNVGLEDEEEKEEEEETSRKKDQ